MEEPEPSAHAAHVANHPKADLHSAWRYFATFPIYNMHCSTTIYVMFLNILLLAPIDYWTKPKY